ncbi:MAG: ABC transporter permease [Candidatus Woesearchaeota archaeon]
MKRIKLPFQKLDTMLLNDIKLFLRDRKSLVLVVLTPFLILSILINIFYFSDVAENIRGVELGVCDLDGSGFDLESDIFTTTLFTDDCEIEVADKVTSGALRGAIVIPEGFKSDIREGKGTELKLFIDNSKQTTAVVTSNAVKAYVSDLNEKIGTEFILEAWKQLTELNTNLRFLVGNLEKAQPVAVELKSRLNVINADIGSIDFASQQQAITDIISFLNLLEIQLDYVENSMPNASDLPALPEMDHTPDASVAIRTYTTQTRAIRETYCNISSIIPLDVENPACIVFDLTDIVVEAVEDEMANISVYQEALNAEIASLNSRSGELGTALTRLDGLVGSSSIKNQELRKSIEVARANLLFLEDKTSNISKSIIELNASLDKFLGDIIRVTEELNSTIEVLDTYTKKDPATILKPVRVETLPVFRDQLEIFYRLPALMSIVLLFVILFISSSLIVNERKGGTMARIFLSPISMFFYVFEKMIYLLLLSMLATASMIIATLLFKVPTALTLEAFIVFMTASAVYVSLGVLIGSISKSENTSLLTCLVIGFPLMFLSGAFSPPELMSKFMRLASQYLPLTINISLLENLSIYHTGLNLNSLVTMAIMAFVFYVLAVIMIRKKPTLK